VVDTRHEYQNLFDVYVPIALAVFALVAGAIVFALIRYRRRDGRLPSRRSSAPIAESLYALVLAAIVAVLVTDTFKTEARVDPVSGDPGVEIDVTASKWLWRFSYPASGASVVSSDVHPATFVVPTGETVRFRLASLDVIHSFYIPALRFKRDAFPRKPTTFDLVFGRGRFTGQCAEFCGLHHADMRFGLEAVPPAEFGVWAASHRTENGA
jgi:cytochrome c oxidase subunit II